MAKKAIRRPSWPDGSSDRLGGHVDELKRNLKALSETAARHDSSEVVLEKHVDHAVESLGRLGLKRVVWWKRREAELAAGSFLLGFSFSLPDVLQFFTDPPERLAVAGTVAVLVTALAGSVLAAHAAVRSFLGD